MEWSISKLQIKNISIYVSIKTSLTLFPKRSTLYVLMDYPIEIDKIKMGYPAIYNRKQFEVINYVISLDDVQVYAGCNALI